MNERLGGKNRKDLIKNIAIIFLAVMLALTFFSNTIMNYSLPEVATQYVQSDSITAKVRGTGTVEADDPYVVSVAETRTIASVPVKVGDTVVKDQILFYLEDKESDELKIAQEELDALLLAYTQQILSGDISQEAFQNAQNGVVLDIAGYQAQIAAATVTVENAKATLEAAEARAYTIQKQLDILGSDTVDTYQEEQAVKKASENLAQANEALATAEANLSAASGSVAGLPTLAEAEAALTSARLDEAAKKAVCEDAITKFNKEYGESGSKTPHLLFNIALEVSQGNSTAIANLTSEQLDAINKVIQGIETPGYTTVTPIQNNPDTNNETTNPPSQEPVSPDVQPTPDATVTPTPDSNDGVDEIIIDGADEPAGDTAGVATNMVLRGNTGNVISLAATNRMITSSRMVRLTSDNGSIDTPPSNTSLFEDVQSTYNAYITAKNTRIAAEATKSQVAGSDLSGLQKAVADAKNKVNSCQNELNAANDVLATLLDTSNATANRENLSKQLIEANEAIKVATAALEKATEAQADLLTDIQAQLNLGDQNDKIAQKREEIQELKEKAMGATVVAPVDGTLTAVNKVAGESTNPEEVLATMQVAGKGFSLSFSVTTEQAKNVKVGDMAELQNSWYYDEISAKLVAIKPDTENPSTKKLLFFDITGESVQSGASLSLSIGSKNATYDYVVPNSAVREDNNGNFILIVESKSSPLGNRYIATRVDVEVLASDDTKSAISGALYGYEYVITTATKPVEAGEQVRLSEG